MGKIVYADEGQVDQAYEELDNYEKTEVTISADFYQTFTPTKKWLDEVEIYLVNGMLDMPIKLSIFEDINGTEVSVAEPVMGETDGWILFDFGEPVSLNTGTKYCLKVESAIDGLGWAINNLDNYAGGELSNNTGYDALFRTYYLDNYSEPTSTKISILSSLEKNGSISDLNLQVSSDISSPVLKEVFLNGKEALVGHSLSIVGDELILGLGGEFEGCDQVIIIVDDRYFLADIPSDGKWSINLKSDVFSDGYTEILAQVIHQKNVASPISYLASVNKRESECDFLKNIIKNPSMIFSNSVYLTGAIFLLGGLLCGTFVVIKKIITGAKNKLKRKLNIRFKK